MSLLITRERERATATRTAKGVLVGGVEWVGEVRRGT